MHCRKVSSVSWVLKTHGLHVGGVWFCNHYSDFAFQGAACIWVWWESNVGERVVRAITKGSGVAKHGLAQKAWAVLGSFTEGRLAVPQPRGAQGTRRVTGLPPRTAWGPTWRGRPGMEGEPYRYLHLWLILGTPVSRETILQALGTGTGDDCHPGSSPGWRGGDFCPDCCPLSCTEKENSRPHDPSSGQPLLRAWGRSLFFKTMLPAFQGNFCLWRWRERRLQRCVLTHFRKC